MQKLWCAAAVPGPVLSTAGWLEVRALRLNPLSRFSMRALHLQPPPSHGAAAAAAAAANRTTTTHSICYCGGLRSKCAWPPLLRRDQAPPFGAWSHGGGERGFRAAEGLRNREKGECVSGFDVEERGKAEEKGEEVGEGERKALEGHERVERRVRSGGFNAPPAESVELLTIPGVGPRNLRKLMDKGYSGVAKLKQLYRDKVCGHFLPIYLCNLFIYCMFLL